MTLQKFSIKNFDDVTAFLRYVIVDLGLGFEFHPDDDFSIYVDAEAEDALTQADADRLNGWLDDCIATCERVHKNIYDVTLKMQISIDEEQSK